MCTRDVNFVCMPRSTLSQMVGMAESLTQASNDKMRAAGERANITYPEVLVLVNLFDHLSSSGYGGVITDPHCPAEVIEEAAMEYVKEIIRMHQFLRTKNCKLVVLAPPGFVYFPEPVKKMTFLVERALVETTVRFSMTAPNMEIDENLRPPPTMYPAIFACISKSVQNFSQFQSYDLTLDDVAMLDWSMAMTDLAKSAGRQWSVTYEELAPAFYNIAYKGMTKVNDKRGITTRQLFRDIIEQTTDRNIVNREYPSGSGRQKRTLPRVEVAYDVRTTVLPAGVKKLIDMCNEKLSAMKATQTRDRAVAELLTPLAQWRAVPAMVLENLGVNWKRETILEQYLTTEVAVDEYLAQLWHFLPCIT